MIILSQFQYLNANEWGNILPRKKFCVFCYSQQGRLWKYSSNNNQRTDYCCSSCRKKLTPKKIPGILENFPINPNAPNSWQAKRKKHNDTCRNKTVTPKQMKPPILTNETKNGGCRASHALHLEKGVAKK